MEQRVEIFRGKHAKRGTAVGNDKPALNHGNAFVKAKEQSEELLKEGWFIHQMVSQDFEGSNNHFESQLMVVYRRKG